MRTYLECIPCFFKLALEQARLITGNELVHKEIMNDVAVHVPGFSLGMTPPEIVREISRLVEHRCGAGDPYKKLKDESNRRAMGLYPQLKAKVQMSSQPLLSAAELAIAGNVIDYGAKNTLNVEEEVQKLLAGEFPSGREGSFEFEEFKKDLSRARTVLYLADNAGEIVCDRIFIEEFCEGREVIFAVRDKPVLNDALVADAVFCGIDKVARVISSGVDAPGTVLKYCSDGFLKIFKEADLVISKGQGNYEALTEAGRKIYFLFKVKCPVIARHSGTTLGDIVLKRVG